MSLTQSRRKSFRSGGALREPLNEPRRQSPGLLTPPDPHATSVPGETKPVPAENSTAQITPAGVLREIPSLFVAAAQQLMARTSLVKKLQRRLDRRPLGFVKVARLITMVHRWWSRHSLELSSSLELMKHIKDIEEDTFQQTVEEMHRAMLFDPSDFKADKQQKLSQEAKRILSKCPEKRTDQEINYAVIALRSCRSISEYPIRMQKNIAQYGMLESYESKRVLLKQGHPPKAFYYIFYGTVSVVLQHTEGGPAVFQCNLSHGDNFGELAIINQTKRQSTVLTKTAVELISISSEAYEKTFLSGGARRMTDPDHEAFMRSLDFLEGWPVEKLENNPQAFKFSYFPRGSVMVKDSNTSQWIYVVKSGSVQVLKKLASARPMLSRRTGRVKAQPRASPQEAFKAFMADELDEYLRKNQLALPPPITEYTNTPIGGASLQRRASRFTTSAAVSPIGSHNEVSIDLAQVRSLSAPSGSRSHAKQTSDRRVGGPEGKAPLAAGVRQLDGGFPSQNSLSAADGAAAGEERQRRRTYIDDLDGGLDVRAETGGTDAEARPVFVRIQTLTKGSVFGLSHTILMDQPSFCLVSNGADCMLISRSFYREHCPQSLLRYLLRSLSPYATDEEMQANLLTKLNWDALRHATIVQTIK